MDCREPQLGEGGEYVDIDVKNAEEERGPAYEA
jgi:hypothetical protein